jgi:dipeptidyl aminopeptidase/acylaminoacyl peptidase
MARNYLSEVISPTLLIVGELDDEVINLNIQAYKLLKTEKKLIIIPGATHLFSEPGTLEKTAEQTANWFLKYFDVVKKPLDKM